MNICITNGDEKLQYNINRETVKISALFSDKIDKYEQITIKEILPCDLSQIIQKIKFEYSTLGKASKKQTESIEKRKKEKIEALKSLFRNRERTNIIEEHEQNIDRNKMLYKGYKSIFFYQI